MVGQQKSAPPIIAPRRYRCGLGKLTRVHVKGFKIFKDRRGINWRCYHRATGIKIDLKAAPLGSAEFFAGMRADFRADYGNNPKTGDARPVD